MTTRSNFHRDVSDPSQSHQQGCAKTPANQLINKADLRPYALVQFGPMVFIALLFILHPSHYTGSYYFLRIFLWYALAKVFEHFDQQIYALTSYVVSGHTLKHLAAAAACYEAMGYLRNRTKRKSVKTITT